jgi:hypothetical protein
MKRCKKCFREFDDTDSLDYTPARDLGDIFISHIGDVDVRDICPECREKLGVINLLGFKP